MTYIKDPMTIETKSFEIIEAIMAENDWKFPDENSHIYKRVIHTSADFDYLQNLKIKPEFISRIKSAIQQPLTVYTDTQMVLSGINKSAFAKTQWTLKCFVSSPEAQALAIQKQMTRSMAAVELAMNEPGEKLFIIGNAPTSIFQLLTSSESSIDTVIGVIGVPVGFVGAVESKQALYESDIPCIVALGRKGGSNIAATILNAILYDTVGR